LVVPSEDPKALAKAMERLATDPVLRAQLGSNARETLHQMDWPVVGPIWEALLEAP
jgi:glycosyltransferase involved in cell wall biosynthesis